MFKAAQSAVRAAIKSRNPEISELPLILPSSLPESYSLSQLSAIIASTDELASEEGKLRRILMLRSCLENSSRLHEEGDDISIEQLSLGLSKTILPGPSILFLEAESSTADSTQDEALIIARHKGVTGLLALQSLLNLHNHQSSSLDPQILFSIIAFTSSRDPWTTPLALSTATSLLSKYSDQTHTKTFIVDYVLQQCIRPLFSKSKPEAVTASGRKAMPSSAPRQRFDAKDMNEKSKPWMYEVPYAVTVVQLAVANSSPEIATSNFPLYIPPLLTLLDSTHTPTRSRALDILSNFVPLLTPTLLVQTGLSEVFEDAITPTLMFLPNITPVDESVALLKSAYHALIVLGSVLYPRNEETDTTAKKKEDIREIERQFWDRLMRKGVLMGYAHASEHPPIVEVLVRILRVIIENLGIHAVKHLKDILPLLTTTLTDPFATSRPSLLLAAIKTLQIVILNCWPRISEERHRNEIVRVLALCWTNVGQAPNEDQEAVKGELTVAGRLLVKAIGGPSPSATDMRMDFEKLFEVDPSLRALFGHEEG